MIRLVVLALAVASCDWSLHRMNDQPRCDTDAPGCNLAPPEDTVPRGSAAAPPPVTRALLERGRDRYERICAACHGLAGDGDAYVARVMTLRRPPSLVDPVVTKLPDARIALVIEVGYGVMPAYGTLVRGADVSAIVHYVRALQQREAAWDELSPALQEEAAPWLP